MSRNSHHMPWRPRSLRPRIFTRRALAVAAPLVCLFFCVALILPSTAQVSWRLSVPTPEPRAVQGDKWIGTVSEKEANETHGSRPVSSTNENAKASLAQIYASLPIRFEPNVGQTDEQVKYIGRGAGYGLFLTATGATLSLSEVRRPQ